MENHIIPITMASRRVWNLVRVLFLMAKKRICSKGKLLLDLDMMFKRGMITGKALVGSLIFHHHHHDFLSSPAVRRFHSSYPREYEFSCSNTPSHHNFLHDLPAFHVGTKQRKNKKANPSSSSRRNADRPMKSPDFFFDEENYEGVNRVLEMPTVNDDIQGWSSSYYSSPAYTTLPGFGFGRSPMVRQPRVTDSPFPLIYNTAEDDDGRVDEAAEEFIKRFYSQLG